MSETLESQPAPEAEIVPDAAAQQESAVEVTEEAPETPEPADPEPDPAPKPDKIERRIANLTRKLAEESRAREAAERRTQAAEELLRVNRHGEDDPAPQQPRQPTQDVDARAEQLIQEREFNRRLSEIDESGKKDIGKDTWEQAKAVLTEYGAVNNQAFLQALAETDNAARIFANLADDPDTLESLLKRPPIAMAARIARMDADLSKPAAKPLSSAPTPATRVQASGVVKEFDPYNPPAGMSMKAWNAEMDKRLPPSLGGKRKSA